MVKRVTIDTTKATEATTLCLVMPVMGPHLSPDLALYRL